MARTKQRENYGNGSITPVMTYKLDANGNRVMGDDGKPVKVEKRDPKGKQIWRVCITLGAEAYWDDKGKRLKRQRKVQRHVHGTLDDAREVARRLTEDYKDIDHDAAEMTFGEAVGLWVTSMTHANTCSPTRLKDYQTMMMQVAQVFGDKPISEIKKLDVERALAEVKSARNLSQRRQRTQFQTVKRIFEYCIDNDWLVRNPCRGLKTPRVTQEVDRRSLTPEECARLRACLDRDETEAYEELAAKERRQAEWGNTFTRSEIFGLSHVSGLMAVRIMLATGCRRGESLGLTWGHVDFGKKQISIVQSLNAQMQLKAPKTKKGIRTIALDEDTLAHLAAWKEKQARALHVVMVDDGKGGRKPVEQTDKTPVCCNGQGGLYDPTKCAEWWRRYRASIGFDTLRMHELRHTAATLALGNGIPVKDVQARLGHASASLTLDIYGHAIPANDQAIADLMGSIIGTPAEPTGSVVSINAKSA